MVRKMPLCELPALSDDPGRHLSPVLRSQLYMLVQEIADLKGCCRTHGLVEEQLQQKDSLISQLEQTVTAAEVQLLHASFRRNSTVTWSFTPYDGTIETLSPRRFQWHLHQNE